MSLLKDLFFYQGNKWWKIPKTDELSENPKNPSLTIYLKKEDETSKQKARELMHILEYTILRDVTKSISI